MDKVRMDRKAGIHMIGIFIALLSGALMSVQGVFNTQVTKSTGIWMANVFVQFTALLVCLAAYLITDRSSFGKLMQIEPKYMLLGGQSVLLSRTRSLRVWNLQVLQRP